MSPVINRVRSSSVAGFVKTSRVGSREGRCQMPGSASATGLTASASYEATISSSLSSPASSHGNLNSIGDDRPPDALTASPCTLHTANQPTTYDLNWTDVNRLELDFVVYQTLPNIRKQLSPNEVFTFYSLFSYLNNLNIHFQIFTKKFH